MGRTFCMRFDNYVHDYLVEGVYTYVVNDWNCCVVKSNEEYYSTKNCKLLYDGVLYDFDKALIEPVIGSVVRCIQTEPEVIFECDVQPRFYCSYAYSRDARTKLGLVVRKLLNIEMSTSEESILLRIFPKFFDDLSTDELEEYFKNEVTRLITPFGSFVEADRGDMIDFLIICFGYGYAEYISRNIIKTVHNNEEKFRFEKGAGHYDIYWGEETIRYKIDKLNEGTKYNESEE